MNQVEAIRTVVSPAEVDARHIPAELIIRNHPAEIDTDWTRVREERGLKSPYSLLRELVDKAQSELAENMTVKARQGDETADLRNREPNIFGRHAFENYMRRSRVEVVLDAVPRFGVEIDVRVHPPEIEVRTPGLFKGSDGGEQTRRG